jgi:hypothetical protein
MPLAPLEEVKPEIQNFSDKPASKKRKIEHTNEAIDEFASLDLEIAEELKAYTDNFKLGEEDMEKLRANYR